MYSKCITIPEEVRIAEPVYRSNPLTNTYATFLYPEIENETTVFICPKSIQFGAKTLANIDIDC